MKIKRVSFICFSFLAVISSVLGNFCDCKLCLRSGMNLANLSTRMEMRSAEVKYCAFYKQFSKDSESDSRAKMSLKKDGVSRLLQM